MPNMSINAYAICPYYMSARERYIACEGLVPGTRCHSRFPTARAMERWTQHACCTYRYAERCPLAAALEGAYGGMEDV